MSSTQGAGLTDRFIPGSTGSTGSTGGTGRRTEVSGRLASVAGVAGVPAPRPLPEQVAARTRCLAYRARRFAYEMQGRLAGQA
ncbi:hypothetical protein [Kitasatospora sp. NPDC057015]|uniref:hypothetical protein n=1 Tax=Kitasatospora sp. NPDC057015 TaxID=3346001 RepID=UPI00363A42D3